MSVCVLVGLCAKATNCTFYMPLSTDGITYMNIMTDVVLYCVCVHACPSAYRYDTNMASLKAKKVHATLQHKSFLSSAASRAHDQKLSKSA